MKPEVALSSIERGISVCPPCGWAARFFQPYEIAGRFVGNLLAWKNDPEIRFAIEALDLQPEDQVLEIGFSAGHLQAVYKSPCGEQFSSLAESGAESGRGPAGDAGRRTAGHQPTDAPD